jgi:hypothetical protein
MRRAFTIVELLVVISVIMILAGILTPVLVGVQGRARAKMAKTMISNLSVALDRYYHDFGQYPPDTGPFEFVDDGCQDGDTADYPDDPFSLYKYLYYGYVGQKPAMGGEDVPGILYNGRVYGPYFPFEKSMLRDCGGPDAQIVVDPWMNPFVYEENRSHTTRRDSTPAAAHHPTRYDIYSAGPNQVLEPALHDNRDNDEDGLVDEADEGDRDNDDITNW